MEAKVAFIGTRTGCGCRRAKSSEHASNAHGNFQKFSGIFRNLPLFTIKNSFSPLPGIFQWPTCLWEFYVFLHVCVDVYLRFFLVKWGRGGGGSLFLLLLF